MTNPMLFDSAGHHPWTVIVRDGLVVAKYQADDSYVPDGRVTVASFGTGPVVVFEVDGRMPEPPNIGEPADPIILGWRRGGEGHCDKPQGQPLADG